MFSIFQVQFSTQFSSLLFSFLFVLLLLALQSKRKNTKTCEKGEEENFISLFQFPFAYFCLVFDLLNASVYF